jgi:hypothetical protein
VRSQITPGHRGCDACFAGSQSGRAIKKPVRTHDARESRGGDTQVMGSEHLSEIVIPVSIRKSRPERYRAALGSRKLDFVEKNG